jgi:hypothetical protein
MSINWDDLVKDAGSAASSFDPLPESDYDLEVIEAKPKMTKDNTKKMYEVKSKVIGGEHNGRFIWDNITLTTDNPNALGFFFRKMAAMGLDANYFASQKPSDEQICGTLRGRRFRAKIGTRQWQGNTKNEIKQYFSATASALPPSVTSAPPAAAPAPQAAPPPAPSPAPAPTPAAPQPTYEQPAPTPVYEQPQAPAAAPVAQDPWAQPAPAPAVGDPWAAQPQVQAPPPPPAPVPAPAPEQPAPTPVHVAQEQPPAPAPAPVQPAPPVLQDQQAPPAPPAAPAAPF